MASPHDALSLEDRPSAVSVRPLRDAFRLPALNSSVGWARRRVLDRLHEWRVDQQACEDAQLLVSELFTNAVRHTASDKVSCELWLVGLRLCLEVTDQGGGPDPLRPPPGDPSDADGESGRGLLLVSVLADDWGIRRSLDGGPDSGHAVWAELTCSLTPGDD
ncbi:ATP-binding protein [Streptomyces sp. WMMB 322]|uniref:ATP-binding protein n=1 Tax=Streptomyces sp. WMMB 322 TaxID=1286821 RepID=UPI00099EA11C|nr:ATP-binding protein [Streptomyces sp. WMMB 322]